jgi:mannose-6-phosphate isomerase
MEIFSQSTPSAWAPFRIAPWFSRRPWGWRDLRPWYDRVVEEGEPIGEAWLTGDQCAAASGAHAGRTLGALSHRALVFPAALGLARSSSLV